jgi:hypothetical protein
MQEFAKFAVTAVQKNWMTDVHAIKLLNPDLTEDQALEKYEENKKFNEKNKTQPIIGETDESENEQEDDDSE